MTEIYVTDHAILRYAQRAHKIPIEALVAEIKTAIKDAVKAGAEYLQVGEVKITWAKNDDGSVTVTTVLPRNTESRPQRASEIASRQAKRNDAEAMRNMRAKALRLKGAKRK